MKRSLGLPTTRQPEGKRNEKCRQQEADSEPDKKTPKQVHFIFFAAR
jgi:hypothetical protein